MATIKNTPRNNRKKRLWILLCVEAVVLIALVVGLIAVLNRNPLEGNWYHEGRLTYKFSKNGKGVMILEDQLARFSYTIEGDSLQIDFFSEEIPDKTYQFRVKGDSLSLDDDSAAAPWTYSRRG